MLRTISAGLLACVMATSAASAQDSAEKAAWEAAQQSTTSEEVFAFLEKYPNSVFAKDAKAYMIDLLWKELAEEAPEQSEAEAETTETEAEATVVRFNQPLSEGSADVIGKSLEELIASTPLFPPVEGLDEAYWKDQKCSNCHEWEQANLCTQANTYLSVAGAENLIKEHPYGGTFKLNLRTWAQGGCE